MISSLSINTSSCQNKHFCILVIYHETEKHLIIIWLTGNKVFVWIMLNSSKKFCVILRASFNVLWSGCETGVYFSKSWNGNYSCSVHYFCESILHCMNNEYRWKGRLNRGRRKWLFFYVIIAIQVILYLFKYKAQFVWCTPRFSSVKSKGGGERLCQQTSND